MFRRRITPTALDFGEIVVDETSTAQIVDVTNIGLAPVEVSMAGGGAGVFGGVQNCQGNVLDPGASCQIFYAFTPGETGPVEVMTGGTINGQSFSFMMTGIGLATAGDATRQFLITPTAFEFGDVQVGTTGDEQEVTVTNVGTAPIELSMAGGGAGVFGGTQNCQGNVLDPGASCRIFYAYTPGDSETDTVNTGGSINGQSFAFTMIGTGVSPEFLITPTGFDFGEVEVGTTSPQQAATVTNTGLAPVEVSMAGGGAGVFGGVQNCQGNVLDPGAECQIFYAFAPAETGPVIVNTGGTLNGQPFAFEMVGTGVDHPVAVDEPDAIPFVASEFFPNPTSTTATLTMNLPETGNVSLSVHDVSGRQLSVVEHTSMPAGRHSLELDTSRLARGVYLLRIVAGKFAVTRRVVVAH